MLRSKKGFTIVELVIVIAIIAILAAVLIPTFSTVIDKANKTTAQTKASTALTASTTLLDTGKQVDKAYFVVDGKYVFEYQDGKMGDAEDYLEKADGDKAASNVSTLFGEGKFDASKDDYLTFAKAQFTEAKTIAGVSIAKDNGIEKTNADIPDGVVVFMLVK